jgi:hypothetical protein
MRRAAAAVLFVQSKIMATRKQTAIITIIYPLLIRALINANARSLLYRSRVGGGKMPSVPKIGLTSRRLSTPFNTGLRYFFIEKNYK